MNYRYGRPRGTMRSSIERGDPRKFRTGYVMHYWHRPEYGATVAGGVVSAHADQSGGTVDMLQASGTLQPAYDASAINGKPAITYDGTDDVMDSAAFTLVAQPMTRIVVLKFTKVAATQIAIDGTSGSPRNVMYKNSNTVVGLYAGGGALLASYTVDAEAHVWTAVFAGASSRLTIDGAAIASGDPGSNGMDQLRYGTQTGGGNYFGGSFGESVGFKTNVPLTISTRMEKRLKSIYGVA